MNDATNEPTAEQVDDTVDLTAEGVSLGPDQGEIRERRTAGRGGRRRGGGAPTLATISWRDIPAQLTARGGSDQHKVLLHARFQHAIDRAAAVAGLTSTHDYVQQWRTDSAPLAAGDVAAQLDQQCAELEAEYQRDRLEALVANGGLDPAAGNGRAAGDSDPDDVDNSAPTLEDLGSTAVSEYDDVNSDPKTDDPNDEMDTP